MRTNILATLRQQLQNQEKNCSIKTIAYSFNYIYHDGNGMIINENNFLKITS